MHADLLPEAIRAAFNLAGVTPVFLHGLNRDAWLSSSVTVAGRQLLLIDDAADPGRLEEIADRLIQRTVDRLTGL